MSLVDYWPTPAEVNACIKPEAEGASDAVLLAVHQPAPLVYRLAKSTEDIPTTEDELFNHFVTEDVPTGAHVVPITGDSGVGKSHLIRLLAARLKTAVHADRYVVVRIPKSASLRKVVELILELLPAEAYASVRAAFENALSEVDPSTAAIRFQSAIDISLRDLSQDLLTRLKQNPANQSLKERLDHARRLPLLLSDAVTRDYFRSGALLRIVQSALSGRQALLDEPLQFLATDFDLPPDIDLNRASEQVRLYYRTTLQAREGHGKTIAADVLNAVTDAAIRQLFHLNDSLGGMTLQDVILEIRKRLLGEERELVILVEDFRALTGIQETLLNVLIQEGVRDGVQTYATMRSAIAVTEGYLVGRDTIATRAAREWIIESRLPSKEEVLRRAQQLVASYLNAARWGQAALEGEQARGTGAQRTREIGAAIFATDEDEDVSKKLDAFGRVSAVPLFPLTPTAIEYLAGSRLKQGDQLVFRARAIIGLLRDVLLFGRSAFMEKVFPPASIKAKQATENVAQWLSMLRLPEEQRARYERLLVIWGNDPQQRSDISRIPGEIFAAFSLPVPPAMEGDETWFAPMPIAPTQPSNVALPPDDARLIRFGEYRRELENWVQRDGPLLNQAVASEIRSSLAAALSDRIDWNQERCIRVSIAPTQIAIPHSRGSGREASTAIVITNDRSDSDGRLRAELLALLRHYQIWKKDLNYAEVDDDIARIGNLLERLLPAALSLIQGMILKQTATASALLAANSRVLGLTESGRTPGALKSFLFGESPTFPDLPEDAPEAFAEWVRTQRTAAVIRPQLTEALLRTCGCYQGTGSTPNGVDIARIVQVLSDETAVATSDHTVLPAELRETLSSLSDLRLNVRAKRATAEANEIRAQLEAELGNALAKNEVVDAMLELAEHLRSAGAWQEPELGISVNAFKTLCEDFRACAIRETLGQLERVNPGDDATNIVAFVAQVSKVNFGPLVIATRFMKMSEKIVTYSGRHASTIEEQFQDVRPELHVERLRDEFDRLMSRLDELQNEGGSANAAASRK